MDILNYSNFKNDIEDYLKKVILKFDLSYNSGLLNEKKLPKENFALYENKFCRLLLNNIESFPNQDVSFAFFLLERENFIEVDKHLIYSFIGINVKEYSEYALNHYNKYSNKFLNSEKFGYLYGLYSLNDLLLKFYYPLLDGSKNYEDYLMFLKNKNIK